jgi:hypothetical protein
LDSDIQDCQGVRTGGTPPTDDSPLAQPPVNGKELGAMAPDASGARQAGASSRGDWLAAPVP